jgi:putative endonuclease
MARLKEHNGEGNSPSAKKLGAKYTRGRRPVELVYSEKCISRSEALKREAAIKKLSRVEKVVLIKRVSIT